jgi:molybdopterin molybdotransferase
MISFDEAVRLVGRAARPIASETVPIESAAGRVLARPVRARIASPRTDVSAMDGYAVREADLATYPVRLKLVGESFAGAGWDGEISEGQCVRIFTGAPVPKGADRVIIQENVRREGDWTIVAEQPGKARHIRVQGGDFVEGEELLQAGQLLHPRAMVAAAAADVAQLELFVRPRVAILGTGDELAEPGSAAARTDCVPESVSFGIAALAEQCGARVLGRTRLPDILSAMEKASAQATASCDLVVVTGGASVGEKDFAKTMFEPLGLEHIFAKVAIKPGKPVWLGRANGALILGLPGNPTSALVTARLLLVPLLYGLSGRDPTEALGWRSAPLEKPLAGCGSRETFHRGRWAGESVEILSNQDSSAQKMLAQANLLVRQRSDAPAQQAGDPVEVLDF